MSKKRAYQSPGSGHLYGIPIRHPSLGILVASFLVGISVETSVSANDNLLRDPTKPPDVLLTETHPERSQANGRLQLQAIIFADGRRVAIINDQRVQERDVVDAARVIAIDRDRVRLTRGAKTFDLKLFRREVQTRSQQKSASIESDSTPDSSIGSDLFAGDKQ